MKRISFMLISVLFVISTSAQNNLIESKRIDQKSKNNINCSRYIGKNINFYDEFNTKANLLNENFEGTTFPPTGWTKTNIASSPVFQWKRDNLSPHTGTWGARIEYSPNSQNEWLISPSINLTTLNVPVMEFWWNTSYYWGVSPNNNFDFNIKVSTNGGSSWTIIWTEDSAGSFESWEYYKKEIILTQFQSATDFKVAFQYIGADGGDLYIDDIKIGEMPVNRLEYKKIWAGTSNYLDPVKSWSGYSKIPFGQKLSVGMGADVKNTGSGTQSNVILHARELTTNSEAQSNSFNMAMFTNDTLEIDSLLTFENVGNYKLALYTTSDSIIQNAYVDTFNVNVNKTPLLIGANTVNLGVYSRDNNYYDGWGTWGGIESGSAKPFQFANLYEINEPTYASSIEVVLSGLTKPNTTIKAILYRGWSWDNKDIVAESEYHIISQNEIPAAVGSNPVAINLFFNNNETPLLEKDSAYFATIQGFGGSDTVYIAIGSQIPQPILTSYVFDYASNSWKWSDVQYDPKMIRLKVVDQPVFVGVNELSEIQPNLFQNSPNPAKETTSISYDLKKQENVSLQLFDLTGRLVRSYEMGIQPKGIHSKEINVSTLTPGVYLYRLKTNDNQKTRKMIIR
jgi:hypothetical protein